MEAKEEMREKIQLREDEDEQYMVKLNEYRDKKAK